MPITNGCFQAWSQTALRIGSLTETECRIIVSRSYYSAYHETLKFADTVLNLGVGNTIGPTHVKLSDALANYHCKNKDLQRTINRLGARIGALHALRIRADYHLELTITKQEAESIVKNTTDVFSIIQTAAATPVV
jgi:uncharacterized protein (UPF0332 family)